MIAHIVIISIPPTRSQRDHKPLTPPLTMRSSSLFLAICVAVCAFVPIPDITASPYVPVNVAEVPSLKEPDGPSSVPEYGANYPNIVSVPDNCITGQRMINGLCRDIWRSAVTSDIDAANVITVPPNCPEGQQFINGKCREIILNVKMNNDTDSELTVATVSQNCPSGQQLVNDVCYEKWNEVLVAEISDVDEKNVVSVPDNCPSGQQLINGQCREIWTKVSVADRYDSDGKIVKKNRDKCPYGQQLINEQCRDMRKDTNAKPVNSMPTEVDIDKLVKTLKKIGLMDSDFGNLMKNIVQVPKQCPEGYKPDSAGVCREIW